jgi:hypothetical protein
MSKPPEINGDKTQLDPVKLPLAQVADYNQNDIGTTLVGSDAPITNDEFLIKPEEVMRWDNMNDFELDWPDTEPGPPHTESASINPNYTESFISHEE